MAPLAGAVITQMKRQALLNSFVSREEGQGSRREGGGEVLPAQVREGSGAAQGRSQQRAGPDCLQAREGLAQPGMCAAPGPGLVAVERAPRAPRGQGRPGNRVSAAGAGRQGAPQPKSSRLIFLKHLVSSAPGAPAKQGDLRGNGKQAGGAQVAFLRFTRRLLASGVFTNLRTCDSPVVGTEPRPPPGPEGVVGLTPDCGPGIFPFRCQ